MSPPAAIVAPLKFSSFQTAGVEIGQPDLITGAAGNSGLADLNQPRGNAATFLGKLYVPDTNNSRIQVYNTLPTVSAVSSDSHFAPVVSGSVMRGSPPASDFSSAGTWHPQSIAVSASSRLFAVISSAFGVVNAGDDGVGFLGWNLDPTLGGVNGDVYAGVGTAIPANPGCQSYYTSSATEDMAIVGDKMIVTDGDCNRVMIWNSVPTAVDTPADLILGQPSSTARLIGTGPFNSAAAYMSHPTGVWSDGTRLIVADRGNNRILVWNSFPLTNSAPDSVIGQPDFTSSSPGATATSLNSPSFITMHGKQLFVCDQSNNRVLIWNSIPSSGLTPADLVLGQQDFTHVAANDDAQAGSVGANPTGRTLSAPAGLFITGGKLLVTDSGNHRVLIFNAAP